MAAPERRRDTELRDLIDATPQQTRAALSIVWRRVIEDSDRNWDRLSWVARRTFQVLGVLVVVCAITGYLSVHLLARNRHQQHQLQIAQAALLNQQHRIAQLVTSIQSQRYQNALDNCSAQNGRHDKTVLVLDRVLLMSLHIKPIGTTAEALELQIAKVEKALPAPARRMLDQGRASTVLLINALAPRQPCVQVARKVVRRRPG